jgi:hypothetical protein
LKEQRPVLSSIIRASIGVGVLLLTAVVLLVVAPRLTPQGIQSPVNADTEAQAAQPQTKSQKQMERNYGSWRYIAGIVEDGQDGHIEAIIHYNNRSIEGLRTYAQTNRELADELASKGGEATLYITFRTYLEPDQFRTWATEMGLQVERSELRVVDGNGQPGTLSVGGGDKNQGPLPEARMNESLERIDSAAGVESIKGVMFTQATVEAGKLAEISKDPLVFLADVTINIVSNELASAGWPQVEETVFNISPTHAFPKMERFGLENFK